MIQCECGNIQEQWIGVQYILSSYLQCDSDTETVNMGKPVSKPQVEDSILTSASETDSEAIVAFNFGGSTGVIIILVGALVVMFLAYQFCGCCLPRRCKKPRRKTKDNGDMSNAILTLA